MLYGIVGKATTVSSFNGYFRVLILWVLQILTFNKVL
jgi:hypothetical protein